MVQAPITTDLSVRRGRQYGTASVSWSFNCHNNMMRALTIRAVLSPQVILDLSLYDCAQNKTIPHELRILRLALLRRFAVD